MSWINDLVETYDYIEKNKGQIEGDTPQAIGHLVQQAQIETTLDEEGNFIRAVKVAKDNKENKYTSDTLIPVTETSFIRTSSPSPHALSDNLFYITSNWGNFYNHKKGNEELREKYYEPYIKNLKEWKESSYTNDYVNAVYHYLTKGNIIQDLIDSRVLELDEEGKLSEKTKIQNTSQVKSLVRFIIESDGEPVKLWEDEDTIEKYVDFYLNKISKEEEDLCYATGQKCHITKSHGKYIRFPGDGAKLISSNDSTNFTFRGRFDFPEEAAQVSYEISEKAHSALRWLIQKYAYISNGYTVLAWAHEGLKINKVTEDFEFASRRKNKESFNLGTSYSHDLKKSLQGFKSDLMKNYTEDELSQNVTVTALDAATTGRMAILYYQKMNAGNYLERLHYWHSSLAWIHNYKKDEDKKYYRFIGAPSPMDIIVYTFGAQRGEMMEADDKLKKSQLQRLLPCIVNKKKIPLDFVNSIVGRASSPQKMNPFNWSKTLSIGCSLVKKYYYEYYGEEWNMALDKESTDRSYLFGRLLAVADKVEEIANFNNDVTRMTAAMRYMDPFSKKPYQTWMLIENSLIPYWAQLTPGSRSYYKKTLNEIMDLFNVDDFSKNEKLNGKYLLGYHTQLSDFWKKRENNKSTEKKDKEKEDN